MAFLGEGARKTCTKQKFSWLGRGSTEEKQGLDLGRGQRGIDDIASNSEKRKKKTGGESSECAMRDRACAFVNGCLPPFLVLSPAVVDALCAGLFDRDCLVCLAPAEQPALDETTAVVSFLSPSSSICVHIPLPPYSRSFSHTDRLTDYSKATPLDPHTCAVFTPMHFLLPALFGLAPFACAWLVGLMDCSSLLPPPTWLMFVHTKCRPCLLVVWMYVFIYLHKWPAPSAHVRWLSLPAILR